jgi:mono/diheme cytochrome c family protein
MRRFQILTAVVVSLLSTGAYAQAPDQADEILRGRYQAILGDCAACHSKEGGKSLAGGNPLQTPFGPIVPPNITPDKETGIGNWSEEDFRRMMRTGIGHDGIRLYPAMPYPAYTKMNDQDLSDLWKYLQTVEPVSNAVEANQLPFPFNIRLSLLGWNMLNFTEGEFKPDPTKSAEWNRGKYIVDGAGHCSACHSPKNLMGADKSSEFLQGASLQGWFAPDITNSDHTGLGTWTNEDIVTYLKTGTNSKTVASGPMAEAVQNSTSKMEDSDLKAIAEYLKSIPGDQNAPAQVIIDQRIMASGQAVYRDNCSACHGSDGKGAMPLFPALAGNQIVMQKSSETLSHLILFGSQGVGTSAQPTTPSMPSLAWRLSDKQIADVLTYVRNSWGNSASTVNADDVANIRPN